MSLQTYKWLLGVERAEFYPRYILTVKKSSHELENHKKVSANIITDDAAPCTTTHKYKIRFKFKTSWNFS